MSFSLPPCRIDEVSSAFSLPLTVGVLRLDLLHPVVSGNKAYKLKEYIAAAKAGGKSTLLTFGGGYSNHIVATAAAASINGLKSIGIIRGEAPQNLSHTLLAAKGYGMELRFASRADYRRMTVPASVYEPDDARSVYVIPEGGYGPLGVKGAMDILSRSNASLYTHILAAAGTGTTLAGLVAAAAPHQKIIGVPVLKNAASLPQQIENLLPAEKHGCFEMATEYHFGGYAKYTNQLLAFMNDFYRRTTIPTDFVYTGKAFFAAVDLAKKEHFSSGSKLLVVHTGGLQGNASLKKGALMFD